jgi:hypothetical protein
MAVDEMHAGAVMKNPEQNGPAKIEERVTQSHRR